MGRKENIKKEIDLSKLPTRGKTNQIDWNKSIGFKVNGIYNNINFEIEIINSDGENLSIKYLDDIYIINICSFQNCRLGRVLGEITINFKIEIGDRFLDGKRDITIIDRKHINKIKYYKYRCNKCGFECGEYYDVKNSEFKKELWIAENSLLKGRGCSCCSNPPRAIVPHINSIVAKEETHWMIKFFQGGYDEAKLYTKTSKKDVYPICPDCGRIRQKGITISNLYYDKSIRCGCNDGVSYPNKFGYAFLEKINIEFISEYSPNWISPKRYDFYFELDGKEYIIEMDGGLGHGKKVHKKSNKTSKETKMDDEYKDEQARLYGVEVIRIDCDYNHCDPCEYIKRNILKSKLNTLFDLSNIDWKQCDKFATSNKVLEACMLKCDNPELNSNKIGEIMGIDGRTIRRYLNKGSKIWDWCNYDGKKEMIKGSRKSNKNGKQVEIFKDGVSLDIFPSINELVRQSEELFGVKLLHSKISLACNGKRNHHKGFTFKYVEN